MLYFAKISKKNKTELVVKDTYEKLLNYIEKWYNTWKIDCIIKGEYIDD